MKIVVTGDAGFIGSHIADRYRELGHDVKGIDIRNRKSLDITDFPAMRKFFAKEKPDIVNHHAGLIEVVKSLADPDPVMRTNVLGTANLLRAAGACGTVKKFIFPSSYTVYGDAATLPADESTPIAPLSPYGLSKAMAEEAIRFWSRHFGFSHLILRYPNAYGPRQDGTGDIGAIAIFAELMRNGKKPTIFGDGSKTRDYAHIEDIVRANERALKKGKNETVCIGTGRETTDRQIFDAVANHMRFADGPIHALSRPGEVRRIAMSSGKAGEILGWKAKIRLEDGVRRYISGTDS